LLDSEAKTISKTTIESSSGILYPFFIPIFKAAQSHFHSKQKHRQWHYYQIAHLLF
jgi:hypothetical protein